MGLMFDKTSETFENYEERLMQFLVANKIESDRRRAVFLSVVGPKTFAPLRDLIAPSKEFKTRMSLLKPSFTRSMQQKQAAQQAKECHGKSVRQFLPKQVVVRNHRGGESVKWVPGSVVKVLGPVTYLVKVCGKLYKRHVNQLIQSELQHTVLNDELLPTELNDEMFQTDVIDMHALQTRAHGIVLGHVRDDDSNNAVCEKQLVNHCHSGKCFETRQVKPLVRLDL
ncbi:hypothetical protein DPX16_18741 [Anabarilius grahami]|uniref:Uncharacterized protein n=1 Tax=Anabarilius grahami TaxID=495550 RepID=A0A3N0Y1V0_ANAGA|nr:hypothetical protein DPX16_18741 [Anabarilius grahami]